MLNDLARGQREQDLTQSETCCTPSAIATQREQDLTQSETRCTPSAIATQREQDSTQSQMRSTPSTIATCQQEQDPAQSGACSMPSAIATQQREQDLTPSQTRAILGALATQQHLHRDQHPTCSETRNMHSSPSTQDNDFTTRSIMSDESFGDEALTNQALQPPASAAIVDIIGMPATGKHLHRAFNLNSPVVYQVPNRCRRSFRRSLLQRSGRPRQSHLNPRQSAMGRHNQVAHSQGRHHAFNDIDSSAV